MSDRDLGESDSNKLEEHEPVFSILANIINLRSQISDLSTHRSKTTDDGDSEGTSVNPDPIVKKILSVCLAKLKERLNVDKTELVGLLDGKSRNLGVVVDVKDIRRIHGRSCFQF
jgi:hypothetical protein